MNSVLEISPLTRVEGHGRIFVYLDGKRVERVQLALIESPRLFEALLLGKSYREVPEIVCRICSLCSTVHRVVSLQAIEKALGIEVSEQVRLYRELILYGGHIQSHALHLFCLVLPDHLGATGLPELAAKAPEELKMGLRIKGAGNLIQETIGGRLIHPVTLIPGGMGKPVKKEGLQNLRDVLASVLSDACQAYELFCSFSPEPNNPSGHCFMAVQGVSVPALFGETLVAGLNDASGVAFKRRVRRRGESGTGVHEGSLRSRKSHDSSTFEDGCRSFPVEDYREALGERVIDHSNAKNSLISGKPVIVGALARLNLGMRLSPSGAKAFRESRDRILQKDIYANNLAQAVELIHAVEHALEIVDTLIESGFSRERPSEAPPRKGSGISAIEAPRGVLIHSYSFDGRGLCCAADIVTPTAINQAAMEQDLLALARSMEGADEQEIISALERLVRAYDPCISCAVHLIKLSAKD